jgi:hypothetical protein
MKKLIGFFLLISVVFTVNAKFKIKDETFSSPNCNQTSPKLINEKDSLTKQEFDKEKAKSNNKKRNGCTKPDKKRIEAQKEAEQKLKTKTK